MKRRHPAGVLALAAVLPLLACRDERRELPRVPGGTGVGTGVRQSELPGGAPAAVPMRNPYEGNRQALADGERLYHWYNCSGCHFAGGGGIGPPLMDDDWIYGGEPQNIFNTIMEGRPNGMPSYRGLLPQEAAWQVVAYVRSLSGEEGAPADSGNSGESSGQGEG